MSSDMHVHVLMGFFKDTIELKTISWNDIV